MKRYTFRLHQVLRVRRIQEDEARAEVLLARRDADLAGRRVRDRLGAYDRFAYTAGAVPAARHLVERARHEVAAGQVTFARDREAQAWRVVADRLEAWTAAAQKVQALERLDERRRAEHALDAQREAEREVDDLVIARSAWRRAEEARAGASGGRVARTPGGQR